MIINLIISLVIVGVVLYLIDLLPMDGTIKQVIRALAILLVVLYAIRILFGVGGGPYWGMF